MTNAEPQGTTALIDTTRPQTARVYDHLLGGKTNFDADRRVAGQMLERIPHLAVTARENRDFVLRAVREQAEQGCRRFLDVGTGIPIEGCNTHDVVQAVHPEARVVYADNDPIVLAHARALLTGHPQGRTAYIEADVRDPEALLADRVLRETIDLSSPVTVVIAAVLHFLADDAEAAGVVRRLTEPLAPGSRLVLTHVTHDFDPAGWADVVKVYRASGVECRTRGRDEVAALVPGSWTLCEPGIGLVSELLCPPDIGDRPDPVSVSCYGLVARKN